MAWFQFAERRENASSGKPRPTPKAVKFNMLEVKLLNKKARERNAAIKPGLQGMTIAPKKKPYNRAFRVGCLAVGALI